MWRQSLQNQRRAREMRARGHPKMLRKKRKGRTGGPNTPLLRIIDVAQDEEGGWVNICTFMIHLCLVIVLEV